MGPSQQPPKAGSYSSHREEADLGDVETID